MLVRSAWKLTKLSWYVSCLLNRHEISAHPMSTNSGSWQLQSWQLRLRTNYISKLTCSAPQSSTARHENAEGDSTYSCRTQTDTTNDMAFDRRLTTISLINDPLIFKSPSHLRRDRRRAEERKQQPSFWYDTNCWDKWRWTFETDTGNLYLRNVVGIGNCFFERLVNRFGYIRAKQFI